MTEDESYPFGERKLKKFSVEQIEEAISKSISELIGDEYSVKINKINYEKDNMAFANDSHEINLSIQRRSEDDEGIPF